MISRAAALSLLLIGLIGAFSINFDKNSRTEYLQLRHNMQQQLQCPETPEQFGTSVLRRLRHSKCFEQQ